MRALIRFFVRYPIWSNVVLVFVVLAGLVGYLTLKKSRFPDRPERMIQVSVNYPGASPQEMETNITLKIEEAMKSVVGIKEMTSVSRENSSSISIEGERGYDMDELRTDVENAVNQISEWPAGADNPKVVKQRNQDRVMRLVLQGEVPLRELRDAAIRIKDDFLLSDTVSQVNLSGYPSSEISIEVDEATLRRYGMTLGDVAAAVRDNNQDITGGEIKSPLEEFVIRSEARSEDPGQIGRIVLRSNEDGSILRLQDVMRDSVKLQFADSPNKTLFNGRNSVSIRVTKLVEEDLLNIVSYVRNYVRRFNATHSDMRLEVVSDSSIGLNQRLGMLIDSGWKGLLLVLVVLGLFLNLRLSFWVAWGIPFSFLGMLAVASLVGITINMISLFGMILVIGILVDDGIVVGENIYTHLEKGKSPERAAIDGAMEVLPSVFASVFTTILVFAAFFFFEGRIGDFIREMAIVVIACLAFSLVECVFILPSHLSHGKEEGEKNFIRKNLDKAIRFLQHDLYGRALKVTIRYRWGFIGVPIFLFLVTMGLLSGGYIQQTFFPNIDNDDSTINLALKPGTPATETEKVLRRLNDKVWQLNDSLALATGFDSLIINTQIEIGSGGNESGAHAGKIEVQYSEREDKPFSGRELESIVKKKVGNIPEAEYFEVGSQRWWGKPVSISLKGSDLEGLERVRTTLIEELSRYEELRDITDNSVIGKREIKLDPRPQAYVLGLNRRTLTQQVRQGFFGEEVQRIQSSKLGEELRVWVRYPLSDRYSLSNLENMRIRTPEGQEYPFSEVSDYHLQRDLVVINHLDGVREIKVEADVVDPETPIPPLLQRIEREVLNPLLEKNPGVIYEPGGQQKSSNEFGASAMIALGGAMVLMILILTLTFRSFPQALIVLTMIPLGLMGSAWGHGLHGKPLSILSLYGLLALSGVVINDAVVFLSKYNSLIKEGRSTVDAAYEAGIARFRAILLTSVTTVVGLYPILLATSRQAEFLIPMAISIVYGVLFGTMFILLFFPLVILAVNDIRVPMQWFWMGKKPKLPREVEPAWREKERIDRYEDERRMEAEEERIRLEEEWKRRKAGRNGSEEDAK